MREIPSEVVIIRRFIPILFLSLMLSALPLPAGAASSIKAGAVTTDRGSLNVRTQPSTGAPAAYLKKGSYITLHSRSGDWWKVEYDKGRYGYCHADYITVVQGTAVSVNIRSGSLNVRSGPGTQHGRTASLYAGENVLLLSTSGGWSRILYHGTKTAPSTCPAITARLLCRCRISSKMTAAGQRKRWVLPESPFPRSAAPPRRWR